MTERKCLVFSFADIEVREREFCIVRNGEVLAVEPKAFRVLLFLLRNPHKLITKDELLDAVWSDTAVSENSLTRSIALLRRLLGDDTHEPRYIATVPTVGYRFLRDVRVAEDGVIRSVDDQRRPPTIETRIPPKTQEQPLVDRRKMPAEHASRRTLRAGDQHSHRNVSAIPRSQQTSTWRYRTASHLQLSRGSRRVCGRFSRRQVSGLLRPDRTLSARDCLR